ncbi:hypothetical protein [Nocardia sp. NPDC004722]
MTDAVKRRITRFWIIVAALGLAVLFGIVHPDGGYVTLSVILAVPLLVMLWAIRMEYRALSKPTLIADAAGLTLTRRLRLELGNVEKHPWSSIVAMSVRTHQLTTKSAGGKSITYRPLLQVSIASRGEPVQQFYPHNYHPAPTELFAYVRTVAPQVRLEDLQQADLDGHQADGRR